MTEEEADAMAAAKRADLHERVSGKVTPAITKPESAEDGSDD